MEADFLGQAWLRLPTFMLAVSRMAGVVAVSPAFQNRFVTPQVRVGFTFLLALLMLPAIPDGAVSGTGPAFVVAVMLELAAGLLIGFANQLLFATVQMAGSFLDIDMGFAMAQIYDPGTGDNQPILARLLNNLALVIFFAINGHHWLLRGVAASYQLIPPGAFSLAPGPTVDLVAGFGQLIGLAVQMILPVLAALLLTSVALAAINRALPQFHLFANGMSLKAIVGLTSFILFLPFMITILEALFSGGHADLMRLLGAMR